LGWAKLPDTADQTDRRRRANPNSISAPPISASALGSGTTGGPDPQFGVPGVQDVPGTVTSFSRVPSVKVTEANVVSVVIAASEITNVPVPFMYGEKVPFVIDPFALL
jgi:hypothetical protein